MELITAIILFLIIIFIFIHIAKKPIYSSSPVHPDYENKLAVIDIKSKARSVNIPENVYTIEKILYIHKDLKYEDSLDYIHKHKELYISELSEIELKYKNRYKVNLIIDTITIQLLDI